MRSFRLPAYLLLSRHHIFYFRVVVPLPLRPSLSRSEIRISLRTSNRRIAISEARRLKVRYDEWFETIAHMKLPAPKLINVYADHALWGVWFEVTHQSIPHYVQKYVKVPVGRDITEFDVILNPDGSVTTVEAPRAAPSEASAFNVTLHSDGSITVADVPNDASEIDTQTIAARARLLHQELKDLVPTQATSTKSLGAYPSDKATEAKEAKIAKSDLRMSTVLEMYRKERMVGKRWTAKTEQQNMSRLHLACIYLNDPDISTVEALDITAMKQDLHYLPTNLPIDGLSNRRLHAVIKLQRRRERNNQALTKTISITTLNAYLSRLSGFMEWCVHEGYVKSNIGKNRTIPRNKNYAEANEDSRVEWEESDLKKYSRAGITGSTCTRTLTNIGYPY